MQPNCKCDPAEWDGIEEKDIPTICDRYTHGL